MRFPFSLTSSVAVVIVIVTVYDHPPHPPSPTIYYSLSSFSSYRSLSYLPASASASASYLLQLFTCATPVLTSPNRSLYNTVQSYPY